MHVFLTNFCLITLVHYLVFNDCVIVVTSCFNFHPGGLLTFVGSVGCHCGLHSCSVLACATTFGGSVERASNDLSHLGATVADLRPGQGYANRRWWKSVDFFLKWRYCRCDMRIYFGYCSCTTCLKRRKLNIYIYIHDIYDERSKEEQKKVNSLKKLSRLDSVKSSESISSEEGEWLDWLELD